MNQNEILVLIPARKNSKGIKNKNIIKINGKPLIEYTLKSVKKSKLNIKNTFIISDDEKVKAIGKKYGANISYERPKFLSKDKTLFIENLMHFYEWTKSNSIKFKYLIILQPTSPLRKSKDIDLFVNLIHKKKPSSIVSISESLELPQESIFLRNKRIKFHLKNSNLKRRQDYKNKSYFINGAIYGVSMKNLKQKKFINYENAALYNE